MIKALILLALGSGFLGADGLYQRWFKRQRKLAGTK
jgi:hypothetical protein